MLTCRQLSHAVLLFVLVASLHQSPILAQEAQESTNSADRESQPKSEDWGSFYDPKNVFCGQYDCYKILGFDYFTWGSDPPSIKEITKSYRSLSRQWHPDKNKSKGAREKFVVRSVS
jgi:hypothetical protein